MGQVVPKRRFRTTLRHITNQKTEEFRQYTCVYAVTKGWTEKCATAISNVQKDVHFVE